MIQDNKVIKIKKKTIAKYNSLKIKAMNWSEISFLLNYCHSMEFYQAESLPHNHKQMNIALKTIFYTSP